MFFLIALAFSYVEYQEGNVLDVRDSANYYDDVVEGNGNNYYTQYYEEGEENGIYEYDGHYVPDDEPAQSMPEYVEKEYAEDVKENGDEVTYYYNEEPVQGEAYRQNNYYTQYYEEGEENGIYEYDGHYVPEDEPAQSMPEYVEKEYANNEEEAEENGEYNYDGKYVPEENLENEGFPIYEQKEYVEEANEENALPYEKEVMVNALG